MAERAGADEEMVFGALMHDVGKAVSVPNHGPISAEMIKPYVRDDVYQSIKHHQDFQGRHYYHDTSAHPRTCATGSPANRGSPSARSSPTTGTSRRSTPTTTPCPLEHFEPLIRKLTAQGRAV